MYASGKMFKFRIYDSKFFKFCVLSFERCYSNKKVNLTLN